MEDFKKLQYLYKIEEIDRYGEVKNRKESTAEHICTSFILANYFLKIIDEELDYKKVTQMLLFHDLVEIETGDTFILDNEKLNSIVDREAKAFKIVYSKFPEILKEDYKKLWQEYIECETREAQFVIAIDELDPIIQALDKKYLWHKYEFTEEKLRNKKQKSIEKFPKLLIFFEELIVYFDKNSYFYKEK